MEAAVSSQKLWYVMRDFKKFNAKTPAYKELPKLGIRCFTPMRWVIQENRDGKKQRKYVPVIQNLLFVNESREILDPIVAHTDKLQYQFRRGAAQGTPLVVPDAEMERFISAVSGSDSTIYYSPEELTGDMIGKDIVITGGPMNGYRGKLLKMQGSRKRRLIVKIEGFIAAAVEVNPEYIQVL